MHVSVYAVAHNDTCMSVLLLKAQKLCGIGMSLIIDGFCSSRVTDPQEALVTMPSSTLTSLMLQD